MSKIFTTEPVFGLAYNLLFEQEHAKNPQLTVADFNKWLHAEVKFRAQAARAAQKVA